MAHIDGGVFSGRNNSLTIESVVQPRRSMAKRSLRLVRRCVGLAGMLAVGLHAEDTTSRLESLDHLIGHALANNPEIRAASLSHQAALARIPQATAWPNPELNLRYFVEEVQTRVGAQEYAFGFSQPIPWPKRLRLQGEIASHAATSAAVEIDVVKNRLVAEITSLWYELSLLTRSIAIMTAHRDLIVSLEGVTQNRFATGTARHADVVRASIELGNVEIELASLRDRRSPLTASLNSLLHRPTSAAVPEPPLLDFQPLRMNEQQVLNSLMNHNPSLRALEFLAASANARFEHAQTASLPDLALGLDYTVTGSAMDPGIRGSGQDAIAAQLRITLPLSRQKYRAGRREAQAGLDAVRARQSTELDRLRATAVSHLYQLRDAEREIVLFRTVLLPKAEESLGALQRAYSSGAASFDDIIEALRVQLDLELGEARAMARHEQTRASLNELLGRPSRDMEAQEQKP